MQPKLVLSLRRGRFTLSTTLPKKDYQNCLYRAKELNKLLNLGLRKVGGSLIWAKRVNGSWDYSDRIWLEDI